MNDHEGTSMQPIEKNNKKNGGTLHKKFVKRSRKNTVKRKYVKFCNND